jgi:general secretion pathway protein G
MLRRRNQRGLTLVELVVAFTIMLILSSMAVPLARARVRAARQRELNNDLREMRGAIDKYKDYADLGYLGPRKQGTNNWPETLDILVEGVKLPGPDGKSCVFCGASRWTPSPARPNGACAAIRTIPNR